MWVGRNTWPNWVSAAERSARTSSGKPSLSSFSLLLPVDRGGDRQRRRRRRQRDPLGHGRAPASRSTTTAASAAPRSAPASTESRLVRAR